MDKPNPGDWVNLVQVDGFSPLIGLVIDTNNLQACVRWPGAADPTWFPFEDLSPADVKVGNVSEADTVWGLRPDMVGRRGVVQAVDRDREFLSVLALVRWDHPSLDDEWVEDRWLSTTQVPEYDPFDGGTRSYNWQPATRSNVSKDRWVRAVGTDRVGKVVSIDRSYRGASEDLVLVEWGDEFHRPQSVDYEQMEVSVDVDTTQPAPVSNDLPHIADLVVDDIRVRKAHGIAEYGTPLQPRNGRKALRDLYEELLDAAQYIRQEIWERDHTNVTSARHTTQVDQVSVSNGIKFRATCDCGWADRDRWTKPWSESFAADHTIEQLRVQLGVQ